MTRDEARAAAEVMLHYANGGEVELSGKGENDWFYEPSPSFDSWHRLDYRIKPEPREFWVMPPSGLGPGAVMASYRCPAVPENWIKVREVIDD